MEASTLQAPAALPRTRIAIGTPLLRFRSDDQLVALFRAGHDEAFRAIHDRYQKRLLAYTRQMLPRRQDAEDALQDVFVRAYSGLRTSNRELALRAWLFRIAHNRCIDELRRPAPPPPEVLALIRCPAPDPIAEVDRRDSLRRLIEDVRRLPEQQRSALLMRELAGMSYADLACSLDVSVPAVKSLLVRARLALARAAEARDTECAEIREELVCAHDRGVRPNAVARRHMRDCSGCRCFRRELRGVTRQFAALSPTIGPLGIAAKVLGFSGGAGGGVTASGATAGGGVAAATTGGSAASAGGLIAGAGHVATLIVAAVATAGGAVEIQHTIAATHHPSGHHRGALVAHHQPSSYNPAAAISAGPVVSESAPLPAAVPAAPAASPATARPLTGGAAGVTVEKRKPSVEKSLTHAGGATVSPTVGRHQSDAAAVAAVGTTVVSTDCTAAASSTALPSSSSAASTTESSSTTSSAPAGASASSPTTTGSSTQPASSCSTASGTAAGGVSSQQPTQSTAASSQGSANSSTSTQSPDTTAGVSSQTGGTGASSQSPTNPSTGGSSS